MITKKFFIQLKSDLCVGSGFSYAGIVDSDVSYNKYGFPYISGKRLKGCLKESAELLGMTADEIYAMFGERAASIYDSNDGIIITDAYPRTYIDNTELIEKLYSNKQDDNVFTQENVIHLYTTLKAQTKLDKNGSAEENTLRFTRAINQYSFIDGKEMVFEGKITFPDTKEETVSNLLKATRNIGMNRNRGMGSVRMYLDKCGKNDRKNSELGKNIEKCIKNISTSDAQRVRIKYVIKNEAPLIISSDKDTMSLDYISGSAVLGAFASHYLKSGNNSANDETFKELFLSNKTVFSDLNLAVESRDNEYIVCHKAPGYMRKLKKTKALVDCDLLMQVQDGEIKEDSHYDYHKGNQPKKLNGKVIAEIDGGYVITEVNKEILYHHTKKNDEMLYFFEAIEPGQLFAGDIVVDKKYEKIILDILKADKMSFGKSRTAQYGRCSIKSIKVEDYKKPEYAVSAGDIVRINLLSDSLFITKDGNYTADYNDVRRIIAEKCGLSCDENDEVKDFSSIQTKVLTGYSGVWNLHKQELPCVAAGSTFAYKVTENVVWPDYLGVKNNEGLGNYEVKKVGTEYALHEQEISIDYEDVSEQVRRSLDVKAMYQDIIEKKLYEEIKADIFKYIYEKAIDISASSLGRLTLMAIESYNEAYSENAKGQGTNDYDIANRAYTKYIDRINSIKRKATCDECNRYMEYVMNYFPRIDKGNEITYENPFKLKFYEKLNALSGKDCANKKLYSMWNQITIEVLTYQKYIKKDQEAGNE